MAKFEDKLRDYVDEFGYDLKSIRYKYCGAHCGQKDLDSFTRLYNQELKKHYD